ncbi:MAG: hypothetical protein U1F54_19850 [Burkholderiales bacterium]
MSLPECFDPTQGNDPARPYWNAERETMPMDRVREIQLAKLKTQVAYLARNSELYKRKFRAAGFEPGDLASIEDLAKLPATTKTELRDSQEEAPPFGLHQAAPMDRIVRTTATSGTSGKPVYQAYTRNDVLRRSESICRGFWSAGVRPGDRMVNGFALSMFSAGLPFCVGIEQLGAVSIPAGAERKADGVLKLIRDLHATAMTLTPSFASYLAEKSQEVLGVPASELGVRVLVGGGEAGFENPSFRRAMAQAWGTEQLFDWASASDAHPNVFCECAHHAGKHHLTPDLVLVELVDPATGAIKPMVDGAEGEYIFTHLDREACPLLRYRTGDVLRIRTTPCACGRTGLRMDIIGRSDDMVIVRGINVYPAAIVAVVGTFTPRVSGKAQVVIAAPGPKVEPPLRVRVELGEGVAPSTDIASAIEARIRQELSVSSRVEFVSFGEFARTATKTKLLSLEPQ